MTHGTRRAYFLPGRALAAVLVAGWSTGFGAREVRADSVLDWNQIALEATAAAPFDPPRESRAMAMVHAAVFDAVNAIEEEFQPYAVAVEVEGPASAEAAAIAAAHGVLVGLYPDQRSTLDDARVRSLAGIPDGPAKAKGIRAGKAAASHILALRADDGAATAGTGGDVPPARPGVWTPTPPALLAALDPGWGAVRPFVLHNGSQFRPRPPPALRSRLYARDFAEIVTIGSATSKTRTSAQTELARFWIATAAQNWNPLARRLSRARRMTLSHNARAFALLNLALADAAIAAWDAKFRYWQWRPVTAIRRAAEDGNPATAPDPSWTPLLTTPPFPDYIAGHTTYAGAAAAVLEHVFGRRPGVPLSMTSASLPGVVLTYDTFAAIAQGVVDARVWGGVHWRTSSVRGLQVGRRIGRLAVRRFCRRRDSLETARRR
jgi:PAP2 superfamily